MIKGVGVRKAMLACKVPAVTLHVDLNPWNKTVPAASLVLHRHCPASLMSSHSVPVMLPGVPLCPCLRAQLLAGLKQVIPLSRQLPRQACPSSSSRFVAN